MVHIAYNLEQNWTRLYSPIVWAGAMVHIAYNLEFRLYSPLGWAGTMVHIAYNLELSRIKLGFIIP